MVPHGNTAPVSGHLAENTPAKLIWIVPSLGVGKRKVEVKTRFSGAGKDMKAPGLLKAVLP
jgi:hypothetical protein